MTKVKQVHSIVSILTFGSMVASLRPVSKLLNTLVTTSSSFSVISSLAWLGTFRFDISLCFLGVVCFWATVRKMEQIFSLSVIDVNIYIVTLCSVVPLIADWPV